MSTIKTFTDAELDTLDIGWRNILTAHVCNGQRYADVAAAAGIPVGTVKSRISRARKKIAKLRETNERRARSSSVSARRKTAIPVTRSMCAVTNPLRHSHEARR